MVNLLKSWWSNLEFLKFNDPEASLLQLDVYTLPYNEKGIRIKQHKRRLLTYYWSTLVINITIKQKVLIITIPYKRTKL